MEDEVEIKYAIKYGSNYMYIDKNNNQNVTPNVYIAKKFETEEKAYNAIKNIKKTYKKYNWQVEEVMIEPKKNNDIKTNKSKYELEKTRFEKDNFSWNETIHKLEAFYNDLDRYHQNLKHKQSVIDRKVLDIKHSVQIYKKNIDSKLLAELWDEERYVKDELLRVKIVMQNTPSRIIEGNLNSSFVGMEYRQYEPRELPELFM